MLFSSLLVLAVAPFIHAASVPVTNHDHDHTHVERVALPKRWYHAEGHPVHDLFKRGPGDDGETRPAVGSQAWLDQFPAQRPDLTQLPAAWTAALDAAVKAGKIPNVPIPTGTGSTNPVYPAGANPMSPEICSATYKCRNKEDIWDAPDGVFASSFDDGPQPSTAGLVQFLQSNDVKTTHFMIGINIRSNPQLFLQAFNAGHDIAVHTYNHPYMTTLSNQEVLAQLGWTMQIIHESTGGRLPRYWRPPYGDSDERVRAIAGEIFGLETVIWNQDTIDWGMSTGITKPEDVASHLQQWISGPKSPGLVILEHEISDLSVGAFITAFPLIAQNGWKFMSLAETFGDSPYLNADSSTSATVTKASILDGGDVTSSSSSSSTSTTTTSSSTSTSSTPTPTVKTNATKNAGMKVQQSHYWTASLVLAGVIAGSLL
ncbi:carbohydrate esterase family 4 protein [Ephemerocybe angulata]|uniref:chitin deacetylase n=1 Tax=Ephemerocybe angulata TaxID=980116 RepID=A0A8H6MEH0_9AGAR|nr:carbohydrate esterase family 4 protein [Tulosesus angulatus]